MAVEDIRGAGYVTTDPDPDQVQNLENYVPKKGYTISAMQNGDDEWKILVDTRWSGKDKLEKLVFRVDEDKLVAHATQLDTPLRVNQYELETLALQFDEESGEVHGELTWLDTAAETVYTSGWRWPP